MCGIAGEVGTAFHSTGIRDIGTVSSLLLPTDGIWRAAIYNLEPSAVVLLNTEAGRASSGNPFFVDAGPTGAYLLWALGWMLGVLAVGVWSFRSREL